MIPSLLIASSCAICVAAFDYHDCGSKDAVVRFDDVSIQPEPLSFGDRAAVAATMRVREPVTEGKSRIEMYRLIHLFGAEIPVKVPCGWGSCTKDLCQDLGPGTIVCQWLKQSNVTCGCPLGPETIKSNDFTITVPKLNSIYSLFLNGMYRIRWTWTDALDREIGCVSADLEFGDTRKHK